MKVEPRDQINPALWSFEWGAAPPAPGGGGAAPHSKLHRAINPNWIEKYRPESHCGERETSPRLDSLSDSADAVGGSAKVADGNYAGPSAVTITIPKGPTSANADIDVGIIAVGIV